MGFSCRYAFLISAIAFVGLSAEFAHGMTLAEAAGMPDGSVVTIDKAVIINRTNMLLDANTASPQMFQVRDDTRAASIFLPLESGGPINAFLGSHQVGDVISFTATISNYMGLFEFTDPLAPAVAVTSPTIDLTLDPVIATPIDLSDYSGTAENLESQYVELKDIEFLSGVGEPFQYHTRYAAQDADGNQFEVWMRSQASVFTMNAKYGSVPSGLFDLTGIVLHAFDGNNPPPGTAGEGYLVMPVAVTQAGDLNFDGYIGLEDLDAVLGNWNNDVTPGDILSGDANGDGYVGLADLDAILGNWNAGTPPLNEPAAGVPEPGSVVVLGALLVVLRRARRK